MNPSNLIINIEKKMEDNNNNTNSKKVEDLKEKEKKNNKPGLEKNEAFNEINLVVDISKGSRDFLNEYFFENEEENYEENNQYTEKDVEIYIDNIKQEFTTDIDKRKFPEEKEYHIKLKFNVLFTNCANMFMDCTSITSIDLSNFDMSKVKNIEGMFFNCKNLISIKFPNSNTTNLTNMKFPFYGCINLIKVNITSLNTKNVEEMNVLFYKWEKLKNLELSNFDIGKVKDKKFIFYGCNHETSFKLPKGINN